jgi:serine/threonine-protein kinase
MPENNTSYNKNIHERLTGIKIHNRYEVIRKIASGGMADVYLGDDLKLKRKVAIKILHQSYAENKNFIARFKREAQILARLNNPNIVTVYDWGEFDSLYFIVMEYVTGKSLKEIIDKKGALDPMRAAKFSIQICIALESAHQKGLIHRDIKPQNIMITEAGTVKVTDFGIAKSIADDVTKTLSVVGTAHYISPEQAQGRVLDHRTDIYSLGILMYEMLTADLPFRGGSSIDISLRHIGEKPQPPSKVFPGIPEDFEKIIMNCLEKAPPDRYQTVIELGQDLKNFTEGRKLNIDRLHKDGHRRKKKTTIYAGAGQYEEIFERYNRRNKIVTAALIALAAVAISLFIVFLTLFITASNRYTRIINSPLMVKVPPVENINASAAKEILSTSGLNMIINESAFSETVPKDYIIEQNPDGNTEISVNSNVLVLVSMGPENVVKKVPNLTGLDIDIAAEAVEEAGFQVGMIVEEYSSIADTGTVIFQDPEYGQLISQDAEINLVTSKGEELVSIPNLVGYDYVYVRTNLESLDLRVIAERKTNINYPPGTVIDILPAPGTEVSKYETVRVFISTTEELINVPDVVSRSLQQAETTLLELNIRYEISYIQVDYSIQKNSVISQQPGAGSQIFPDDSIILFVGQ